MLPVKLKLVSIKNILSQWLHIGCLASHIILLAGQLNMLASLTFAFFFTGQLDVLAYLIFLLANSTCWPFSFFFSGQLNVLAFYNAARWISSALVVAFPHAWKIFLEVLAIDGYRKLDTI